MATAEDAPIPKCHPPCIKNHLRTLVNILLVNGILQIADCGIGMLNYLALDIRGTVALRNFFIDGLTGTVNQFFARLTRKI